jgi:antitoxin (DNA-binding transcriptional repressor) of toxin-antitoxin stability system
LRLLLPGFDRCRTILMKTVSVDYAARHLDLMLLLVEQGESVILTRDGHAVARLVAVRSGDDDEVPPAEVEEAFYGD